MRLSVKRLWWVGLFVLTVSLFAGVIDIAKFGLIMMIMALCAKGGE